MGNKHRAVSNKKINPKSEIRKSQIVNFENIINTLNKVVLGDVCQFFHLLCVGKLFDTLIN